MALYDVTITGKQKHIQGKEWKDQTDLRISNILDYYWDEDYPKPEFDGNNWELNGDQNIRIEESDTITDKSQRS